MTQMNECNKRGPDLQTSDYWWGKGWGQGQDKGMELRGTNYYV